MALCDFSVSAKALGLITHKVVRCFVKQHQTDAILDMCEMLNTLDKGFPVYMCVRESGFDTIKRFNINGKLPQAEVTNDEEFEIVKEDVMHTLGADAFIKVYPYEGKIDVIFNREYEEFELRNIKYEMLGLEPMIEVNFVDKFGM